MLSSTSSCINYIFPTRSSEIGILYKLARLYLTFFLSGFIHMCGDRMLTGKIVFGSSLKFFMLQAVGITIEMIIRFLWRYCNPGSSQGGPAEISVKVGQIPINGYLKDNDLDVRQQKSFVASNRERHITEDLPPIWIRCVGFAWFALWAVWTVPYMMDPICVMEMASKPQLDLSGLSPF